MPVASRSPPATPMRIVPPGRDTLSLTEPATNLFVTQSRGTSSGRIVSFEERTRP